jgi:S-adenosylmethionine:tRNA ribosyltransferase-isomerase
MIFLFFASRMLGMLVSEFDFAFDESLVASEPMAGRDGARLLVVPELVGRLVSDLPDILPADSLVVMNDTKVIPARLFGMRGGRSFEVLLHKDLSGGRWLGFVRNLRRLSAGDVLSFGEMSAEITAISGGSAELRFDKSGAGFFECLERVGSVPLPPYIKRPANARDKSSYQTVYARREGAVAAPTAGLHFTRALMDRMGAKGMELAFLTLHVGAGTFLPVKAKDTKDHVMHSEYGILSAGVADAVNRAKSAGRPVVAVGTTTLRLLESAVGEDGALREFAGETNIFITPPYDFKTADMLITNFHLPKSTLFMLVCAFAGMAEMRAAYAHAVREKYRFYSYGDATLLRRKE